MSPTSYRAAPPRGDGRNVLDTLGGVNRLRATRVILAAMQFQLRKIGHVVLNVADLDRAVAFYTGVLGLEVSDRYPDSMVPGGMVFLRLNPDHHGIALVGGATPGERSSLNHFAFEVGSLDEVFRARAWL